MQQLCRKIHEHVLTTGLGYGRKVCTNECAALGVGNAFKLPRVKCIQSAHLCREGKRIMVPSASGAGRKLSMTLFWI